MNATVQKWGNSLAFRIPQVIARQLKVIQGDEVELSVDSGGLHVRPAAPRYSLSTLVRGIKMENQHGEDDWGGQVGKEAW